MRYWIFKSEPDVFSFEDLKQRPSKTEPWNGVRNYQVRNMMRDLMEIDDSVLFYHSSCPQPGIAGLARVASTAKPDPTQFDANSPYFDPKSTQENPRWLLVDVAWQQDFKKFISLDQLKSESTLSDMIILRKGNRLSITEVQEHHYEAILNLGGIKMR